MLHELRVVKTDLEIELLKEAVDITAKGFRRTLRFVKPGVAEYEVEAELAREFIKRRGKFAYTPIVAAGKNNCVLHYLQNDQVCKKGQLLLMDVARAMPITMQISPYDPCKWQIYSPSKESV